MRDKVLNMIRETMLHENAVEQFSFDFDRASARLDLSQPREDDEYPDYSLRLTFTGITEFHGSSIPGNHLHETNLLDIECMRRLRWAALISRLPGQCVWFSQT
jgi:hypothetical protein